MKKRASWLGATGRWLLIAAALTPVGAAAQTGAGSDREVREVHAAARPLDAHVDVLMPTTPEIYRTDDGVSQVTVDKLVAGGMRTVTFAVQSPTGPATAEGIARARAEVDAKLARLKTIAANERERIAIAFSAADIERSTARARSRC